MPHDFRPFMHRAGFHVPVVEISTQAHLASGRSRECKLDHAAAFGVVLVWESLWGFGFDFHVVKIGRRLNDQQVRCRFPPASFNPLKVNFMRIQDPARLPIFPRSNSCTMLGANSSHRAVCTDRSVKNELSGCAASPSR